MGPKPVNMSAVEWQTLWTFPIRRYLIVQDVDTSYSDAVVSVKVKNSILRDGFVLKVNMRKEDGTWRINRINNLEEYLEAMDKVRNHKVKGTA